MQMVTQKMVQQKDNANASLFWNTGDIFYKPKKYFFGGSSGGGGSGGTTTTVQKSDPWSGQQPYLEDIFNQARAQYDTANFHPPSYFPDSTVVPFSPETQTALNLQTARALTGSPVENAANQQLTDTLNGNYLYGGQGFNQALDAASHQIIPQVQSAFAKSGRLDSGLAQTAMTQALSDSFANQYSGARQNQMQSMLFAPSMANQDYTDISKLAEVGSQREALSSENMQDAINRYYANDPYTQTQQKLNTYANLIQGNYGGTTSGSQTSPLYRGNSTSGLLGGALGGASLASSLGASTAGAGLAGPWGLALGAVGGGLLGGIF